jgi:hypothetical protein
VYTYPGAEAYSSDKVLETHTRITELEGVQTSLKGVQKARDTEDATSNALAKFYKTLRDGQSKKGNVEPAGNKPKTRNAEKQKETRKLEGIPTLIVFLSRCHGGPFSPSCPAR